MITYYIYGSTCLACGGHDRSRASWVPSITPWILLPGRQNKGEKPSIREDSCALSRACILQILFKPLCTIFSCIAKPLVSCYTFPSTLAITCIHNGLHLCRCQAAMDQDTMRPQSPAQPSSRLVRCFNTSPSLYSVLITQPATSTSSSTTSSPAAPSSPAASATS